MKKPTPDTGTATAAHLINWAIDHFTRHPDLRRKQKINLSDLVEAGKVRRQLLKKAKPNPITRSPVAKPDGKVVTVKITMPNMHLDMCWYRHGESYLVNETGGSFVEVVEGEWKGHLIREDHTDLSDQ